jgi:hypothetical protein
MSTLRRSAVRYSHHRFVIAHLRLLPARCREQRRLRLPRYSRRLDDGFTKETTVKMTNIQPCGINTVAGPVLAWRGIKFDSTKD